MAEALFPVAPSNEVTALVVLTCFPAIVPVTFTAKVQDALSPRVAPDRLMFFDPVTAVMVPPPQLPARPFGVDTTRPEGKLSVNPTAVRATVGFGLAMVKLKAVELTDQDRRRGECLADDRWRNDRNTVGSWRSISALRGGHNTRRIVLNPGNRTGNVAP